MIETIASAAFPVNEALRIKKNRFVPQGLDPRDIAGLKRVSIVTGIHGDELEGQYVCYELAKFLNEHPEKLRGIVDIYPAMNPLGIDSIMRGIPGFDLDMNRVFPGANDGDMVEYIASSIIKDLSGSDLVMDIHASNIFLTEVPQIRINRLHTETLVPLAKACNVDFIWIHDNSTVLRSTLAYSLNSTGTPTLVVEMGVGMRLTPEYCFQLLDGIFNVMSVMGVLSGMERAVIDPVISDDPDDVVFMNSERAGIFIKEARHGMYLKKGALIGRVADPLTGTDLYTVTAPESGWLFTIREYPVVDKGSLIARILKNREG